MKINRRRHHHQNHPHRDYSWPPPSSISNSHSSIQSNQKVTNTLSRQSIGHKIDHIRKLDEEELLSPSSLKNNEIRKSMSSSSQSLDGHSEREKPEIEWPPMYHYKHDHHSFTCSPGHSIRRTYSLPEDEITNQRFFEPIRMFWESISSPTSSLDRGGKGGQRQPRNFNSLLNGKKWKSFENFNEPITIDDEDGDDKVLQLLVTEQGLWKKGDIEWYVKWGHWMCDGVDLIWVW